ncbi:uncharacterized protein [Clytia hemisphaerica]
MASLIEPVESNMIHTRNELIDENIEEAEHISQLGDFIGTANSHDVTVQSHMRGKKFTTVAYAFGFLIFMALIVYLSVNLAKQGTLSGSNLAWFFLLMFLAIIFLAAILEECIYRIKLWCNRTIFDRRTSFRPKQGLNLSTVLLHIDGMIPTVEKLPEVEESAKRQLSKVVFWISKYLPGQTPLTLLLTGSTAERFNAPVSEHCIKIASGFSQETHALITDYDFMLYNEHLSASFNSNLVDYHIETEGVDPGFAKLYSHCSKTYLSAKHVTKTIYDSMMQISVRNLPGYKEPIPGDDEEPASYSRNHEFVIQQSGPAVNIRIIEREPERYLLADLTYAVKCKEWPTISNWSMRCRKWPSCEDVTRIVKLGFHLVPKSNTNDKKKLTWRFSFSIAEVELSKLLKPTARKCFIAMRIIGKDFLTPTCKRLRSYHLKTLFLHFLEKTDPQEWQESHIEGCFLNFLDYVINAIQSRECWNFWLIGINLFQNMTEKDAKKLLRVCKKIKERPTDYIERLLAIEERIISRREPRLRSYGAFVYWA